MNQIKPIIFAIGCALIAYGIAMGWTIGRFTVLEPSPPAEYQPERSFYSQALSPYVGYCIPRSIAPIAIGAGLCGYVIASRRTTATAPHAA